MKEYFKGRNILVIGGTGTVGRKIIDILLGYDPNVIRVFSRDEYKQFMMQHELKEFSGKLRFLVGDVRDYERIMRASRGVDVIFHLAAMKHVPACEYNPFEAVKTNVVGTQNVIQAAVENHVKRVVFTSSDKAISPTNAMGATKLLAERLISSANYSFGAVKTVFSSVRFGNVMNSRGSIIPLFKSQILIERKITLTHAQMSRFMMSINEAAFLTIQSAVAAKGGEVFVLKMPVVKLGDFAEVVIEEVCKRYDVPVRDIKTEHIGLRPGEKMFEELMTEEESETAYELDKMYAITSPFYGVNYDELYKGARKAERKGYSSAEVIPLNKEEIRKLVIDEVQ